MVIFKLNGKKQLIESLKAMDVKCHQQSFAPEPLTTLQYETSL